MNMVEKSPAFWRDRLRASAIHLAISLAIAALSALLVFGVWYPYPYREISGGRELFLLLVTVDVILGPLITLAVFNRTKPWTVLRRDLAFVAAVQLAALGYGLWTVSVARPVHLIFEFDRFSVVHAVDVPEEMLHLKPPGIEALPWKGPTLLSLRDFKSNQEQADATLAALAGLSLGARPDLWQPYLLAVPNILKAAKPVSGLKQRFPDQAQRIDAVAQAAGRDAQTLLFLPMNGRKSFWTVLLDPVTADVVGFLPLDSF
jgi:hypothetical protein